MSNGKVFIITEAGSDIGYGHLARCQSLCQAFAEVGICPILLVDGDQQTTDLCRDQSLHLIPWHNDSEKLWAVIKNADMVIIDSLIGSKRLFSRLQQEICTPVFIDDFIRRSYSRGVVIDWTIQAENKFYNNRHPHVTYLLGTRYAALRREFWDCTSRPTSTNISNVIVTFGGSDVANMTPRVLKLLACCFQEIRVHVVIGPGFTNLQEIMKVMHSTFEIHLCPDARKMSELMLEADLAVATGGQTLYELARIGLPTIAIKVVDNQENDICGWVETKFIRYAGTSLDNNLDGNIINSLKQLEDHHIRRECSRIGQLHVDGNGARRIVSVLSKLL